MSDYLHFIFIAFLIIAVGLLISYITNYQYFNLNFSNGILLYQFVVQKVNIEVTPNRVYEFKDGFVKVISTKMLFLRMKLPTEYETFKIRDSNTLIYVTIEPIGNSFIIKLRLSWYVIIPIVYFLSLHIKSNFEDFSTGSFQIMDLIIPLSIVAISFYAIKLISIHKVKKICEEFCLFN